MYKDCVIEKDSQRLTKKGDYLSTLKEYPICVATTGLHDSIGWKLAEYVAHSKAIVSEKLHYDLPGSFREGENYLEFASSDSCLSQVGTLMSDTVKRNDMMLRNHAYYASHVNPEALVLNTLLIALSKELE